MQHIFQIEFPIRRPISSFTNRAKSTPSTSPYFIRERVPTINRVTPIFFRPQSAKSNINKISKNTGSLSVNEGAILRPSSAELTISHYSSPYFSGNEKQSFSQKRATVHKIYTFKTMESRKSSPKIKKRQSFRLEGWLHADII